MTTITTQPASEQQSGSKPLRDFRQEVTDNIIRMLENGVAPWQKPWDSGAAAANMPMNPTSERAYRGGNAIHLMATALQKGYQDPRWMTYKQASDRGWQVRRGEKGTQIEFWDVKQGKDRADAGSGEAADNARSGRNTSDERPRLIHRVYTVFNAAQIDGIPAYAPRDHTPFEVAQSGERILAGSGAKIAHGRTGGAFYDRAGDAIHLPARGAFKDAPGYYGTALHELAHWTGHPSRLNRATLNESYRFGDVNYAKEELRAELASVFLAAERGIPHDPAQHTAYVGSWVKELKEDKNEIFRAAHDASAAADFLLSLERERSLAEEELAVSQDPNATTGLSPATILEEETAEIHRDRERLEELDPGTGAGPVIGEEPGERQKTESLAEARTIAAKALGESATLRSAQTESGVYRGAIIGETELQIIQRGSGQSAVAHPKELLDRQPQIGETVRISYSNSRGLVRESHERSKSPELGR
jgi:antirestriction protein ArdC